MDIPGSRPAFRSRRVAARHPRPRGPGQPLHDQPSSLIYPEQGLGDAIPFRPRRPQHGKASGATVIGVCSEHSCRCSRRAAGSNNGSSSAARQRRRAIHSSRNVDVHACYPKPLQVRSSEKSSDGLIAATGRCLSVASYSRPIRNAAGFATIASTGYLRSADMPRSGDGRLVDHRTPTKSRKRPGVIRQNRKNRLIGIRIGKAPHSCRCLSQRPPRRVSSDHRNRVNSTSSHAFAPPKRRLNNSQVNYAGEVNSPSRDTRFKRTGQFMDTAAVLCNLDAGWSRPIPHRFTHAPPVSARTLLLGRIPIGAG